MRVKRNEHSDTVISVLSNQKSPSGDQIIKAQFAILFADKKQHSWEDFILKSAAHNLNNNDEHGYSGTPELVSQTSTPLLEQLDLS